MLSEIDRVDVRVVSQATETNMLLFEEDLPNAVILDLVLEDGPAFHLIQDIKSIDPGIKVIVLTNYAFNSYRQLCLAKGADYFFDKSSEFDKVVDIIEQLSLKETT
jgi:DNA-binding NarL/FixJ family response regulator